MPRKKEPADVSEIKSVEPKIPKELLDQLITGRDHPRRVGDNLPSLEEGRHRTRDERGDERAPGL